MEFDKKALSDITVFNKYAKFDPQKGRRETFEEICDRNKSMHIEKYPFMKSEINDIYEYFVKTKKVLPSMRSLQFGGRPILMAENRIFNCAYSPAEDYLFFSELMFLLLGGTGMGYSVQKRHVDKLPTIKGITHEGKYKYQVQDSIIGWSDAIKVVVKAFFFGKPLPEFDYRDIREKGSALITTGGMAPGPEPLKQCVNSLIRLLKNVEVGSKLRPIQVHDMACIIADAVLSGGIRRAALISLFDRNDQEMLSCKSESLPINIIKVDENGADRVLHYVYNGEKLTYKVNVISDNVYTINQFDNYVKTSTIPWFIAAQYRARANNSAVLIRGEVTEEEFKNIMRKVEESGCGEPGVYWTNNADWGTNPCCEIALRPYQMCNLTEVNAGTVDSQEDFNSRVKAASFLGTLQAGYTDFHYLNHRWKLSCEADALLGVSMTGIASGVVTNLDLEEASKCVKKENERVANKIGINPAARTTCVKPAGTTSLVLGVSSGIHAWHAPYYIRRMRAGKDEALAQYLMKVAPQLVEQDVSVPHQVVLSFPQKAPNNACTRNESMFDLLERVRLISEKWVKTGHRTGDNIHNVSCTISVKNDEWEDITDWMWENRDSYNGISVLPYFGSSAYPQLPFEDCDEETYLELLPYLKNIDITRVMEDNGDGIDLAGEVACAGGACEIVF